MFGPNSGIPIIKNPGFRPWVQKVMPGVYDDTLSYYELLSKVVAYLNQMNDQQNEIIDWMHEQVNEQNVQIDQLKLSFIDFRGKMVAEFNRFKDDVENRILVENVGKILTEWYDNGKLADIINKDVFDMKVDKETFDKTIKEQDQKIADGLKENSEKVDELVKDFNSRIINPDAYEGGDRQKLQQAVDDCLRSNGAKFIQLYRIFDISGQPAVNYNRGDQRYPLRITGGGVKRSDEGFMFSSEIDNSSDLYFDKVYFEGVNGAGVKAFDCDKLIRIHTTNCQFRGVDTVAYGSNGKVVQSYRSIGDTVFSGRGWAFDFDTTYDVVFDNLTVEQRENGIRLRANVYNARIINSVLEGLTGTAVNIVSSTTAFTFINNYFENNKVGNLVFGENCYMQGVTVQGNTLHNSGTGWADYLVVWGDRANSVTSIGNTGSYAGVHNAEFVKSGGIFSTNDSFPADKPNKDSKNVIWVQRTASYKTEGNTTRSDLGQFRRYTLRDVETNYPKESTALYRFEFPIPLHQDDIISVHCNMGEANVSLLAYWREGNKVVLKIKNEDTVDRKGIALAINVLQPILTVSG